MTGSSMINLGELSKPATVLIEKVSSAVGILYEPRRLKKKAKAETEIEKIKYLASVELSEIQQRGIERLVQQEGRKQENIESITSQAASNLDENANVKDLEEDWVAHFFNECDSISDKEMQSLWANMLSGEATKPGSFSKRTVDYVASMDKKDAKLFTDLCQFSVSIGRLRPLIYDLQNDIYNKQGINFDSLQHLNSIGLISFEPLSGYRLQGFEKESVFHYFGIPIELTFPKEIGNDMQSGKVFFTEAGEQLALICGAVLNMEFHTYLLDKFRELGLVVGTQTANKT